tara:strand:+ start:460 stop:786 length:327 start_codon:yes stop_codon:yes gene_type:complete
MAKEIKDVLSKNYPEMEWVLMDTPTNKVEFEEYFIVHTLGSHKKPTWEELETQLVDMQAEYDSREYARKRKAEYDQLNQFEMMFDDQKDGTTTWLDKINEIKAKHPKE